MDNYDIPHEPIPEVTPVSASYFSAGPKTKTKTVSDRLAAHLAKEFNGKRGFDGQFFHRPIKQDPAQTPFDNAAILESDEKGRYLFRNHFGQVAHKYEDVAAYLSPTIFKPRRLVVQATRFVYENRREEGDWGRTSVTGSVPTVLRVSEWALRPSNPDARGRKSVLGRVETFFRILMVAVPLQILLVLPTTSSWDDDEVTDFYKDFPGYHWRWPKHAINPLDRRPGKPSTDMAVKEVSSRKRMLRPRQLMVLRDGKFELDDNPAKDISYLFISYTNMHFDADNSATGRDQIEEMAAYASLQAGKTAYWLDFRCRAPGNGSLLDSDVYRMCDVIRGCYQVVVMLKGNDNKLKQEWGSRMWTLPEALLAPGDRIYFCTPSRDTDPNKSSFKLTSLLKVEMTGTVWDDPISSGEDGGPTRLLAEHFSGLLTLSRLEILSNAIVTLSDRFANNYKAFAKADIAYALMGLLHYHISKDKDDTPFQAIARLSLSNDSDRLIERMVCLFPDPHHQFQVPSTSPSPSPSQPQSPTKRSPFELLARPDLYHTHLWDITPLCQIVGVADEDNTILLDNCKALHIRWKNFPRMKVVRDYGLKKLVARLFVHAGAWWFLLAFALTVAFAPFIALHEHLKDEEQVPELRRLFWTLGLLVRVLQWLDAGLGAVAFMFSLVAPFSVRRLYGGQVLRSAPCLVGFEGVMELKKLEKIVFGNCSGRLSYAPSATPFSYHYRDARERVGLEPGWIASSRTDPSGLNAVLQGLPKGHHLFTLVDTGCLSVCVFSAERPPTVALLCGREGGMLRAVLCSWRFGNDCLYRETVVRLPSDVYENAKAKSWLKVCLGTR
ncbi:hypothetical protein ONS95_007481 [Cadophora gregata]|uniref:uncharacterized protein n=1 Tax=Cadophora gregata TaxID=51156 RepID=UPI0026DAE8FC|nr:uncharacterized protein ONS95_007481 [Cadophora gregata]KAK0118596.1 hypothetical protein ONS96_011688 [Cadophora gregata f. sp. sojae]KAK0125850.1 hypothetical protein ONS95_007481 [Cadophora gregata]